MTGSGEHPRHPEPRQSERAPSPILEVKAFGEFQAGIGDRCDEPPVAQAFTEVGSYRFFTG